MQISWRSAWSELEIAGFDDPSTKEDAGNYRQEKWDERRRFLEQQIQAQVWQQQWATLPQVQGLQGMLGGAPQAPQQDQGREEYAEQHRRFRQAYEGEMRRLDWLRRQTVEQGQAAYEAEREREWARANEEFQRLAGRLRDDQRDEERRRVWRDLLRRPRRPGGREER